MNDPTKPAYLYRAACRRVVDGDTFVADVDLGFRVSCAVTVRLRGVNAPEHNKPGGQDATDFLRALLLGDSEPTEVLLQSFHDAQSFARWICDAWLPTGQPLADAIIVAGHGKPFDAKTDHWTP